MADPKPTKPTRRERVIRAGWAFGGAVGAAHLAVVVNVTSEQINIALALAPESAPGCPATAQGVPSGHQGLKIWLRSEGERGWPQSLDDVRPGDPFDVELHFYNGVGGSQSDVVVQAYMPDGFELVAGTSRLKNANNPHGKKISDRILDPGVNVGHYTNGSNAWLMFTARMKPDAAISCGSVTVHPISARLSNAEQNDDDWVSAAIVDNGNC